MPRRIITLTCTVCHTDFETTYSGTRFCSKSCKRREERLRRKNGKYAVVYWIKNPEHTDPYSEGYIGTSVEFHKRRDKHKKKGILRGDRSVEILHDGLTRQEGLELEEKYRPSPNIGWNEKRGGY